MITLEEQVFVYVLSKETGLRQQHTSFFSAGKIRKTSPHP